MFIEIIFGFVLFLLACIFMFYLPGMCVLEIFGITVSKQAFFLRWTVGLSVFLLFTYITTWLQIPYAYLIMAIFLDVWMLFRKRKSIFIPLQIDIWSLSIIIFGSLCFASFMFLSGLPVKGGMQFIGVVNAADGLLHIGYLKDMLYHFPPQHAGLANIPLRGYHYYYDFLLSRFVLFFHFSPFDLYYRYFPIAMSLFYGGGFYLLTKEMTKNILSRRLALFFAYFAQSSAVILSFFIPIISPTNELGSIYPIELILNPAIVPSIGMLLCALYLLFHEKPTIKRMILIGFLIGIITEMKVYTGIIGIGVFFLVAGILMLKERKYIFPLLIGCVTTIFITAVTYIPNNWGAAGLWFSPFFAYSIYMQDFPFTSWNWELQRIIFRDHHNIPHLMFLYIEAFGLFWLLSLGSRIVFLLGLPQVFRFSFWKNEKNIAILGMIGIPIIIGSLFVQSVSILDTKQFFWIGGTLLAIPAGIALGNFLSRFSRVIQLFTILCVILFSWQGITMQLRGFIYPQSVYSAAKDDLVLFAKISSFVSPNAFLVYLPTQDSSVASFPFSHSPVVAAFTGRSTYYEFESAQFDLGNLYTIRQATLAELNRSINYCQQDNIRRILKDIASSYIVTTTRRQCLIKLSVKIIRSPTGLTFYALKL